MCAVIHYTLEEHPFFRDWTGDEIAIIRDTITELDVTAGQVLFNPGDASVGCYLVESGEVALFSTLDGQLHEIDRRGPGDSFGEVSMITGEPHRMRAMAVVDSHLAKIPTRGNSKCLFGEFNCPLIRVMRPMVRHLGSTAMISARKAREKDQLALIGRMVNDIVHDFKSPFQTIALGTETIGRLTQDRQIAKLCSAITAQVNRMLLMAGELAEFSRGRESLVFEKVKLHTMQAELRSVCAATFARKELTITVDCPDIEVELSPAGFIRVMQNLMMNASEAMPGGGMIDIRGEVDGEWLVITFADSGPGIPEVIRDTFWQPFVTHGKKGGVGLGTAIVKSIVEGHGGSISFATETGRGTTFTIRLPLSRSTLPA